MLRQAPSMEIVTQPVTISIQTLHLDCHGLSITGCLTNFSETQSLIMPEAATTLFTLFLGNLSLHYHFDH